MLALGLGALMPLWNHFQTMLALSLGDSLWGRVDAIDTQKASFCFATLLLPLALRMSWYRQQKFTFCVIRRFRRWILRLLGKLSLVDLPACNDFATIASVQTRWQESAEGRLEQTALSLGSGHCLGSTICSLRSLYAAKKQSWVAEMRSLRVWYCSPTTMFQM